MVYPQTMTDRFQRHIAEDGLWVVGAGARKQARRRAAKLAMVVAESLGTTGAVNLRNCNI